MSKNNKDITKLKTDAPFNDEIQQHVVGWADREFAVARRNMQPFHDAFQEYDDMIHCRRDKKNDYEPDIFLPEFVSRLLAQIGNFVSQYFGSRDFVEVRVNSDDPKDVAEGKASKKLLNVILGKREAHYFQKLCRLLMFVNPGGFGIIKGGYEQEIVKELVGYEEVADYATDDAGEILAEDGNPYTDPYSQIPAKTVSQKPVYKDKVVRDTPTFDVYPIQNVWYDQKYAYTLKDKGYVWFESDSTLDDLKKQKDGMGYFNLHRLEDPDQLPDANEQNKPHSKKGTAEEPPVKVSPNYKIMERWGLYHMIETDKGFVPGIDEQGNIKKDAVAVEGIMTFVAEGTEYKMKEMIRFQKSPHTERPMARFLCYVDAVKDSGIGDGETSKELQIAANDTFNLNAYRTELATKMAFKAKRWSGIDENIKLRPDKAIMLENPEDLVEFKVQDDIQGGMYQLNTLASRMDDVMGAGANSRGMPSERRETATVGAIMSQKADIRMNLKTSTLEWIGFAEFYDMLLTLCNDFMLPETLVELIGQDAYAYNPNREDKFEPVSQALETEESKQYKLKVYEQLLGRLVAIPNPKTPQVLNYIIGAMLELLGGDFKHFKRFMFNEDPTANALYQLATGAGAGGGGASGGAPNSPGGEGGPQNQFGLPQGGMEQAVRSATQ